MQPVSPSLCFICVPPGNLNYHGKPVIMHGTQKVGNLVVYRLCIVNSAVVSTVLLLQPVSGNVLNT